MSTPPPSKNLSKKPAPARTDLASGVVRSVSGNKAKVDITGAVWTVAIPNSVKGVMVGRIVKVRTDGNGRTIASVTTNVPPVTYTGSATTTRAISKTLPAKVSGGGTSISSPNGYGYSYGGSPVQTRPDNSSQTGELGTIWNRIENLQGAMRSLIYASDQNGNSLDRIQAWALKVNNALEDNSTSGIATAVNGLNDAVAEHRALTITNINDQRNNTPIT